MVCFIHRPEYYKIYNDEAGHDLRGMAEFIIAKHRNGAIGTVLMRFRNEFARFQDTSEGDYAPPPGQPFKLGSKIDGTDKADSSGQADGINTGPVPPPVPPLPVDESPFGPMPAMDKAPF